MSKQGNDFWIKYQKDYAHIDMGAMLEAYAADQVATKDTEIAELKAENERLRDGVAEIDTQIMLTSMDSDATKLIKSIHGQLESLLSPAPVTEGKENERQLLKDRYAAISDKIEAIGECHDSEKMEELKHKISDRLDEIGWNSPKNEDQK